MKQLLAIAFLVFLSACSEGITRLPEPDKLIPRDTMVLLLSDLVKIEAHIQTKYVSVAKFHKVMVNSGDTLLSKYDVTLEEFEGSLEYYASRQEEMIEIYSDALEILNQELGELQSN